MRLALAAALAFTALASPAQAFWCGTSLVLEGDSIVRIRDLCGEPASAITTTESRTTFVGGTSGVGGFAGTAVTRTVQIDILVYDFGPTRFMEELRFENGVLVSTRALGRGTRRRRDRD
jgi:hypothetical protein